MLISAASTTLGATVGGGAPGAAAAFNEVINNCLASTCLSIKWDKEAPGYHAYGPINSPSLCNVAEAGCMDAVKQQLACNSAPGQPGCTSPSETRTEVPLSLGNHISQYLSPNGQVVINGTNEGQTLAKELEIALNPMAHFTDARAQLIHASLARVHRRSDPIA